MARIFISYSRRDSSYVRVLADGLRQLGYETFYAEDSLAPGEPFQAGLSQKFRDADAVVLVLSKASADSRYMIAEAGAALGYFEERGRPALIPVVIDDTPLPVQLSHIQAIIAPGQRPHDLALEVASAIERIGGRQQARAEEKRENRERVESNAAKFIQASLTELRARESHYRLAAYAWYAFACASLLVGLALSFWRSFALAESISDWISLMSFVAMGIVILGLLVAVARFAFMMGKSFMVESLRNADRIHAISFGEFYLNAFPDRLDWTDLKDAFQHWNIDRGSQFMAQSHQDFDHEIFRTAVALVEAISGTKSKK